MKALYITVAVLVALAVVLLTINTVTPPEPPSDSEIDLLGSDIQSAEAILEEFDSLGDLGLSEINESLFNQ